jgi:hypothetical protein
MENIDVELILLTSESMLNQRANKLYFKAQGQIGAYKTISKCLNFRHITNFLALSLTKIRNWE